MRGARLVVLAALIAACGIGGGTGLDLPFLDVVYQCDDGAGHAVELCYYGDPTDISSTLDEQRGGRWSCGPTPRHLGPCIYSCAPYHRGCNALNGCFCP